MILFSDIFSVMPRGMPHINMYNCTGERKTGRIPRGLHVSDNIPARPASRQSRFIPDLRLPDFSRFSQSSLSMKIVNIMMPLGTVPMYCIGTYTSFYLFSLKETGITHLFTVCGSEFKNSAGPALRLC